MDIKDKIEQVSYTIVSGLFADMCNKENQGENFTWERFPDFAARYASTQAFAYFQGSLRVDDAIREKIYIHAKSVADDFVARSGF